VQKNTSVRLLAILLVSLVLLATLIGVLAGFAYSGTSFRSPGQQRITMDHVFNGTFWARRPDLNWVAEGNAHYIVGNDNLINIVTTAGDGVFSLSEDGYIKLVDLKSNVTTNLISIENVKDVRFQNFCHVTWNVSSIFPIGKRKCIIFFGMETF
jgi:dipeptidyl aminopeptidase